LHQINFQQAGISAHIKKMKMASYCHQGLDIGIKFRILLPDSQHMQRYYDDDKEHCYPYETGIHIARRINLNLLIRHMNLYM
jgi:hypothetical protein